MADTTNKISVIDENGLDALLEAVFSALKGAYVSQNTFEEKLPKLLRKLVVEGLDSLLLILEKVMGILLQHIPVMKLQICISILMGILLQHWNDSVFKKNKLM